MKKRFKPTTLSMDEIGYNLDYYNNLDPSSLEEITVKKGESLHLRLLECMIIDMVENNKIKLSPDGTTYIGNNNTCCDKDETEFIRLMNTHYNIAEAHIISKSEYSDRLIHNRYRFDGQAGCYYVIDTWKEKKGFLNKLTKRKTK